MDIDEVRLNIDAVKNRTQGKRGRPMPQRIGAPAPDLRRPQPQQRPSAMSKNAVAGPSSKGKETTKPDSMSKFQCYRCGQNGHMMRNCTVALQEITKEHINVLATQMESLHTQDIGDQEEDHADDEGDDLYTSVDSTVDSEDPMDTPDPVGPDF